MSGFPWRDQRPAGPLRKNLPVCSYHSQVDCVIARCLPEHQVQPGKELEQQGHRILKQGEAFHLRLRSECECFPS